MDKEGTPERCPFCGQPLVNAQAIAHLHRAEANFEQRLKLKAQQEFKQQLVKEKAAIREAERVRAAKLERLLSETRKELAKAEAQAESKARKIAAAKITQERRKLEASIHRAAEQRMSRQQRAAELMVQRLQQQNERVSRENETLQRQLQRLTAADQGELNEQDLLRTFKQEFPDDDIGRIGRGRRGADIIQHVRYRAGQNLVIAGTIVYECKDTQSWQNDFLEQARQARKTHGTPHVVLIARAFPRNQKDLYCRDGIPVVHPARAVYLAHVVREAIIGIHRAGLSHEDQAKKTMELYRYLSSDEFRLAVERVIETSRRLKEYLHDERQDHERTWARREAAYNDLAQQVAAVDGAIHEIIERPAAQGTGKIIPLSQSHH